MSKVIITDTTLRDGSHSLRHQFSLEDNRRLVQAMDEAGIDIIEIGHGDGLAGSTCNYGFSAVPDTDMVRMAAQTAKFSKIAVLLLPGIGTVQDLIQAKEAGAQVVRVATHVTEADISQEHIAEAKKLGLFTVGFLMMAHRADPQRIAEEGKKMASYGADVVYVTDSAGALLPEGVRARVAALKDSLQVPVGFHAHNNLGLAIGNSLAAVQSGAEYIDGSLGSMGAGAGNTATEMLVAVLEKAGIEKNADLFKTLDACVNALHPVLGRHGLPLPMLEDTMLLGFAGVYSSFMLHAKNASKRFGVDYRDIIIEAGRRNAVGGQEDWLFEIAKDLGRREKR